MVLALKPERVKELDFLNVSLNLQNSTYRPYKKLNDTLLYVHSLSNHPGNVIKEITNSTKERLSKNLSNEELLNTAKSEYEDALKKNGFKVDFKHTKNQRQKPKNRSRNTVWFNLPFNKVVSTNVAKFFLRLFNRHFPNSHRLHKLFNRKTVKVTYCCIQNITNIYKGHNSKITSTPCNQLALCNCRVKEGYPMDGKYQTMDAVYDCCVTSP